MLSCLILGTLGTLASLVWSRGNTNTYDDQSRHLIKCQFQGVRDTLIISMSSPVFEFALPNSSQFSPSDSGMSDDSDAYSQFRSSAYYIMEALFIESDLQNGAIRWVSVMCVFREQAINH